RRATAPCALRAPVTWLFANHPRNKALRGYPARSDIALSGGPHRIASRVARNRPRTYAAARPRQRRSQRRAHSFSPGWSARELRRASAHFRLYVCDAGMRVVVGGKRGTGRVLGARCLSEPGTRERSTQGWFAKSQASEPAVFAASGAVAR